MTETVSRMAPAANSVASSSVSSGTRNFTLCQLTENSEQVDTRAAIGVHAPVLIHTISSQFASAASTSAFYPFDVLKTRFMSQDGTAHRQHNGQTYHSISRSLQAIYKEEGLRTLFRGCPVALFGSVTAWGIYMFLYRSLCNMTEFTSYFSRSGVSIVSSLISSFIACPIFLIKSRMQLEEATRSCYYRTFRGGLQHAIRTSGVRSLWRGVSLQLVLVFPNALGLPTYDFLKSKILNYHYTCNHAQCDLTLPEVFACSATTKFFLAIMSHPLVMLRVRLQDQRARTGEVQYKTLSQTALTVLKTQGMRGMYRGFTTTLVHSLPRSLMHYVIYEKTLNMLCHQYNYVRCS